MKCEYCHTVIPEDSIVCPKCGKDLFVISEYNLLDDILEQEMINHFASEDSAGDNDILNKAVIQHTNSVTRKITTDMTRDDRIRDKLKQTKKAGHKNRKKWIWFLIPAVLLLVIVLFFSYSFYTRVAALLYQQGNYDLSMSLYTRAEKLDPDRADAYIGEANIYLAKDMDEEAESLLKSAIADHDDIPELYQALIDYYEKAQNLKKIDVLFDTCKNEDILKQFEDYVVNEPEFSLEAGEYNSVQTLELEGDGTIYYTLDGTEVTQNSPVYSEPIELPDGEWHVQAMSVSKKGIESDVITQEYTINLPAADSPTVTPSTGQYSGGKWIRIEVPEGCTAYYTMDGSIPTEESNEYKYAIRMPSGSTTFSAILINENGKKSSVTRRYYEKIDE